MSVVAAPADLYPTGIPFEQIRASNYLEQQLRERAQASEQLAQLKTNERLSISKFIRSPLGISVIVFLFVLLIIYIANPPFAQADRDSPLEEGSPSLLRAAITALIFAVLVYVAPIVYRKLTAMQAQ